VRALEVAARTNSVRRRNAPFEAGYCFVSFICFANSASSTLAGRSLGRVQFLERCSEADTAVLAEETGRARELCIRVQTLPGARAILSVSEEMKHVFWVGGAALLAAFPFIPSGLAKVAKDKAATPRTRQTGDIVKGRSRTVNSEQ
jgi:hypothetical protein